MVLSVDPRPGFVGVDDGALAQFVFDAAVGFGQPAAHATHLLGQRPGADVQAAQVVEHPRDLAIGQTRIVLEHRRHRQGVEPQLRVRQVGRRRLIGVPRFHPFIAMLAEAAARAVTRRDHLGGDDVLDEALVVLEFTQFTRAVRAAAAAAPRARRQRHLHRPVDLLRQRPQRRLVALAPAGLALRPRRQHRLDERRQRRGPRRARRPSCDLAPQRGVLALQPLDARAQLDHPRGKLVVTEWSAPFVHERRQRIQTSRAARPLREKKSSGR